jgi:hypothetical protein
MRRRRLDVATRLQNGSKALKAIESSMRRYVYLYRGAVVGVLMILIKCPLAPILTLTLAVLCSHRQILCILMAQLQRRRDRKCLVLPPKPVRNLFYFAPELDT